MNSRPTNAHSSNSCLYTNPKVLDMTQMVFLVYHHTKTWKRRSSITYGLLRTMALLTEPWFLSVLLLRKWMKHHMLSSVDTTQHKLLEEPMVSRHSRTSKTGLEPGPLRVKACTMVANQCKIQVRILHIQLLLILEVHNFLFHQMYSRRLETSGPLLSQTLTAPPIKPSATLRIAVTILRLSLSQSVSKWVITYSRSTQNNTYTNQATINATSLSTSADSQERIRTSSSSVMPSSSISTQYMTSIEILLVLVSTNIPRVKSVCTNQEIDQSRSSTERLLLSQSKNWLILKKMKISSKPKASWQ